MRAVKSFKKNYMKDEGYGANSIDYSQKVKEHLISISSDDRGNGKWFEI